VTQISQQISLLNQQGSQVVLGNVLMIPIDQSLLYIRPLYVQSSRNPLPEFKKIIVVYGNQAAMEDSLGQALTDLFGAPVPGLPSTSASGATAGPTTITPSTPGPQVSSTVAQLLARAQAAYAQAQNDLKAGDLGKYQTDINQAGDLLNQASQAAAASAAPAPTTPSTTAPPATTAPPGPTTGSTNSALGRPPGPG